MFVLSTEHKKVQGKRQSLSRVTTFSACSAISNAAKIRKDRRILLEVQQGPCQPDGIAKELSYHESCYTNYTHHKTLANMLDSHISLEDAQHSTAYDRALQTLAGEVEGAILSEDEEGLFARMSDLRSKYVDFLKQVLTLQITKSAN